MRFYKFFDPYANLLEPCFIEILCNKFTVSAILINDFINLYTFPVGLILLRT
jgi:hypothetical protein